MPRASTLLHGIDVNLPVEWRERDSLSTIENRVRELGLAGAWVAAIEAREREADDLTDLLRAVCSGSVLSAINVLFPPSGITGTVTRFYELASDADCRIARLCPTTHGYPLADWVVSPLPELCERFHFSLLLDFNHEPIPWTDVVAFARAFPAVPMILLACRIGEERVIGAALDYAPNLLLELSKLTSTVALEELVSVYGHHRFVFGSGGSSHASRQIMSCLQETALDPATITAIVEGNARLLASGAYAERYL